MLSGISGLSSVGACGRAIKLKRYASRFVAVCAALVLLSPAANSQSPPQPLSFRDALARVAATNPKLAGQEFALLAAQARTEQAGLLPAIEVGVDVENALGTGVYRSFKSTEATLRLGTVLELNNKRGKRIDAAERERDILAIEKSAERLDVLAETARRFILVLAERERLRLAQEGKDIAQRTQGLVAQRVAQGRALSVESSAAKLAITQSEIGVQERQAALSNALALLAASWGGEPQSVSDLAGNIYDLPAVQSFADLKSNLEKNPDIAKFASARRLDEARLRLAEANRTPDVSANAGLRHLQATKDQAIVFSVSVPLGTSGRSAPYEREAQARLAVGKYEEEAARANLVAALYGLYAQIEAARNTAIALQDRALPDAKEAERLTDEGYRAGRLSLLELQLARQSTLSVQQQAVAAAATYHQLFLEIERLTGQPLYVAGEQQSPSR